MQKSPLERGLLCLGSVLLGETEEEMFGEKTSPWVLTHISAF